MSARSKKIIAAYVPVIHRGYLDFFKSYPDVEEIFVFDQGLLDKVDYLRKELRALTPTQQVQAIKGLRRFKSVKVLKESELSKLDIKENEFIFPDEDISREIAGYFKHAKVSFYPVFLRWDRRSVSSESTVTPDRIISADAFDKEMMRLANKEGLTSSNIWRRVGALIVINGKVVLRGSNKHIPTEHSLWMDGDPRSTLKKGVGIEVTTDMHAEARLIAKAANKGVALKGASIYVSTFPCPNCSKLIAEAGIAQCFYSGGYSILDGESTLKSHGVKLIHVDEPEAESAAHTWVPYKSS